MDGKVLAHLVLQSKVLAKPLTDLSAWVGFCTSSPQQGVKYQHWYLIFCLWRGSLLISHDKYIKDGKVLAHLGFQSKVLPGPLTVWSAWVGFCTSSPQLGFKYQLWYLIFFMEEWSLLISHEKYIKDGKVVDHLGFKSKVLPGSLTDLSAWVGFCTSSPQ
jgi:hypothetical protein